MDNRDVIARCVVASGAARVVVVTATEFAREAARRHDARATAAIAMGRAGIAGLLLATLTKGDEQVTLQLLGNGALGGLTVDASSDATARVFVANPRLYYPMGPTGPMRPTRPVGLMDDGVRPRLGGALGVAGIVTVVRDLGLRDNYRGQTPLVDGEIDSDVERYLTDSEQIDSALGCEVFADGNGGITFAGGILVQSLPGGMGTEVVVAARGRLRGGEVAAALSRQAADRGASSIGTHDIAAATLGGDIASLVQLGEALPVRFHCPCSRERAAATLALLGNHELVSMIKEDGAGEVTCEFCRSRYQFSDENLETIRRSLHPEAPPPS
ncbi:MAG: Hsp33 family molecular chaperone HslO [Myxococcales bacterium]